MTRADDQCPAYASPPGCHASESHDAQLGTRSRVPHPPRRASAWACGTRLTAPGDNALRGGRRAAAHDPSLPWLSHFPELNVRTYATVDGRPGIWFLSLDAGSTPAVHAARRMYRLPYFRARMEIARSGQRVSYRSSSESTHRPRAALHADYAPAGPRFTARPGTLEHFLCERYCLYALDGARRVHRAEIHHPPWPLQAAEATIHENTMTAPFGIELPAAGPLLHYASRQDVVIWPPRRVRG